MDWGYIITIILTVGFGISTIILTIKVTKRKKPVWAYSTRHIIGRDAEAPPELKYIFGSREVSEVYKTTIIFFNEGNDSLRGDLVTDNRDVNEPIAIRFIDAEILRPPTTNNKSKGANQFSTALTGKDNITLHFPILNHNDGAIIEVWHTKCKDIEIQNADITRIKEFIRQRPEGFYGNIIVPVIFVGFFIYILIYEILQGKSLSEYYGFLIVVIGFTILVVYGLLRQLRYKMFPRWSRIKEEKKKER